MHGGRQSACKPAPECGLFVAGRVDQENLLLKKQGWRHLKSLAEFFDVLLVQLSFAIQDFGDDALRPEQRREVLLFEVVRRHQFRQHFHGRDRTDGKCSSS